MKNDVLSWMELVRGELILTPSIIFFKGSGRSFDEYASLGVMDMYGSTLY